MKLGLLGGTFDPIHFGHLLMAELARETLRLDRVLFVPAADPPHKRRVEKTAARHRRNMVELAITGNGDFELCLFDLERPGPHYSVDLVSGIRTRHAISADDCFFIIGSDSLVDLPRWHRPGKLVTLCRIAVAFRPSYLPDISRLEKIIPELTGRLAWVPIPAVDFAASTIRDRVRTGLTVRYQLPDSVRHYIDEQKLYSG
jgi:nicotinate-nucleotide adenylyltransferase